MPNGGSYKKSIVFEGIAVTALIVIKSTRISAISAHPYYVLKSCFA